MTVPGGQLLPVTVVFRPLMTLTPMTAVGSAGGLTGGTTGGGGTIPRMISNAKVRRLKASSEAGMPGFVAIRYLSTA